VKGLEVLCAGSVIKAQFRGQMGHVFKALQGFGADALSRGVRPLQLRVLCLKRSQFPVQAVVFSVGYLRLIENIVAMVVVA